jgi:hypothetical protein
MLVVIDKIDNNEDRFKYFFELYLNIFNEALNKNLESISLPILSDGDSYRQFFPELFESFFSALKEFQIEQTSYFSKKKSSEDPGIRTALKFVNLINNQEIHQKYLIPYLMHNG